MLSCTVAICTRGRPELLGDALRSAVAAAALAGDTEVMVVEQGGRSAEHLATDAGATFIPDAGWGVSHARNVAAAAATGSVILFTDDDCIVPTTWIADHRRALDEHAYDASFGAVSGLAGYSGEEPVAPVRVHTVGDAPWDIGHSSNMAVRRAALQRVGGFDERIGPGSGGVPAGEDADLIVRLLAAGSQLVSGIGQPVRHVGWRDDQEIAKVLEAYESGAGVWIGASIRARRPRALVHLNLRRYWLRDRVKDLKVAGRRGDARRLRAAFVRGLVGGLRLAPWPRT